MEMHFAWGCVKAWGCISKRFGNVSCVGLGMYSLSMYCVYVWGCISRGFKSLLCVGLGWGCVL